MKCCLWCDNELVRKEGESPSEYAIRSYCNKFCSSRHNADKQKLKKNKKPRKPFHYYFTN